MFTAISINNVTIRLPDERWQHISIGHPEIAGYYFDILETIESPDRIYEGNSNELLAVKKLEQEADKHLIVIYKELNLSDGFIITAFLSKKVEYLKNKKLIWEHLK